MTTDPIQEAIEFIKSKKCYPMNHNRLPDYMIEENKKIDDIIYQLRAMQETSVEELKREVHKIWHEPSPSTVDGWNECIDHLHTTGRLRTALPEIEGLGEALEKYNYFLEPEKSSLPELATLRKAAATYFKLQGDK